MSDIVNRVCQLVSDVLGVPLEDVDMKTTHADVSAWDSLNIVKLAMAVEAEFGVTISPDDAVNFTSVRAIVDVLQQKSV